MATPKGGGRQQKFVVGDIVETSKGEKCIIHYIGKVDGLSNVEMYGIEYIDGTIAEYDGTYKGKKYFNGKSKRCSFIKYNKIRRKTKYHHIDTNINNNGTKRRRSVKNKQNHYQKRYIFQCHIKSKISKSAKSLLTASVSLSSSSSSSTSSSLSLDIKRKSLPTKLNRLNEMNNIQKQKKR